ncbi:Eukaryotic DNA topoisomerase I, catalytic core [compost metagenome]
MSVRDQRLARAMRTLEGLPGQHLFKYRDAAGDLHPVTSDDVNAYIRDAMGEQFSAKDFRTWAGTVSAARALRDMEPPTSPADARRKITACIKAVSNLLGNTPSVCRTAYVHPCVLATFADGDLADALPGAETKGFDPALIRLLSPAK